MDVDGFFMVSNPFVVVVKGSIRQITALSGGLGSQNLDPQTVPLFVEYFLLLHGRTRGRAGTRGGYYSFCEAAISLISPPEAVIIHSPPEAAISLILPPAIGQPHTIIFILKKCTRTRRRKHAAGQRDSGPV